MSCLRPSPPGCSTSSACPDTFNCSDVCPDFQIKRHDTRPSFKVEVTDDDGPLDLTGLVLEASMWAPAKLKAEIDADDEWLQLAGNIGFEQVLVGDVIVADRVRAPEHMLVVGFNEADKLIQVTRGYNGTTASVWKKSTKFRIFRFMNQPAVTEMAYESQTCQDGVTEDVLSASYLVYDWRPNDTCVPGCFGLEYKLLKMLDSISTISSTTIEGCDMGTGVEWVRRFPVCGEFVIKVCPSPTAEI